MSGGNHIGSDTYGNGLVIIRYPTAILSPKEGIIFNDSVIGDSKRLAVE